ncbi:hypothetical protein A3A76_00160 [Candidatus Woesebacteria bacterium RIFCSPLOWO2_01_FULL_39_23]|uniref:HAD family hydrolase n=1 Tax=Candidatus Woesebacteria bacterium RIFCSPHIGHO2_01_FULL_40_22 TaxID=1802499 RepID=A0A1F7YIF4_9BACT|nr:MAG: hypothetical protein A2141_02980 [Candidatus Woesebacteria bacterium RBG_16_40_11]OGM26295.1 MAG: hypothetical protein A2628_03780 [Candidatus Woesebacteria bacterium RIFCSPHIGHO2_01_FULL_40_22]OGM35998.1 MAG: hypothetical protein A3E41_01035 [Candidatus Woesebacteria bacterium RIFCSPHIGHO2_12_FULL_38_9]OGM62850.1 MAG: hypothetical protein A3A76_00160 [Candidatus Woesebacteria bacterium RIFCSPLOWO2_01_FULL_39_23]
MRVVGDSYQYIILDWDGCLANTMDVVLGTLKEELLKEGILTTDREIIDKAFGKWLNGFASFGVVNPQDFFSRFYTTLESKLQKPELFDGVKSVLTALKRTRKKLALLVPENKNLVEKALTNLEIKSYFDQIYTKRGVDDNKNDGESLVHVLDLLGGTKRKALFVGNSPRDVIRGKRAGITTIIYFPESNHKFYKLDDFEKLGAKVVIKNFRRLLDFVD